MFPFFCCDVGDNLARVANGLLDAMQLYVMPSVQGRWKLLKTLTQKHILLNMRKFAFSIAITIVKDKDLQKYGNNDNDLTFSNSTKSLDIKFFILFKVFKLFA